MTAPFGLGAPANTTQDAKDDWFLRSLRRLENLQRAPTLFGNLDLQGHSLFDSLSGAAGSASITANGFHFDGIADSGFSLPTTGGRTYYAANATNGYIWADSAQFQIFTGGVGTARMTLGTGLQMGAPTGGDKGLGTINVSSGVFLNGTSYTNPDYALEHYYTGEIVTFADNAGAAKYLGLMPLDEVDLYLRETLHLPGVHRECMDIFERADVALEKIEQAWLYIVQLHKRVAELEARLH